MARRRSQKTKKSGLPLAWIALGVAIFIVAIFLAVRLPGSAEQAGSRGVAAIERVSLEDAKSAFDAGSAVFVDVRSADAFRAGHIPGAVSLPFEELALRQGELEPADWIITYCT